MKKLVFLVSVVLLMSACQEKSNGRPLNNGDDITDRPQVTNELSLFGLSVDEVLSAKYESVNMKCQIWESRGAGPDLNEAPVSTSDISLLKGVGLEGLNINFGDTSTLVSGQVESMNVFMSMEPVSGGLFAAKYILSANMNVSVDSVTELQEDASSVRGKDFRQLILREGESQVLYKGSVAVGETNSFHRHIECSLVTTVKSDFVEAPPRLVNPY